MKMRFSMMILATVALAAVAVAVVGATPALAQEPTNRAGLVVIHGSGQVLKMCVKFSEAQITGLELLEKAGLELNVDPSNPVGVGVCSIQREGCTFPTQQCFCQCQGATCTYWSYWHLTGGVWKYSGMGTASSYIKNGDMDGWVWGAGTVSSANPPPQVTFSDVCPDPTATPGPTATTAPTATPEPTAVPTLAVIRQATPTPEPTNTRPPTNTPGPSAGQLAQTPIVAGEATRTATPTTAGQPTATWTPVPAVVPGAASPTPANQPAAALPMATPAAAGTPTSAGAAPAPVAPQAADQPAQALGNASTAPFDASANPMDQPAAPSDQSTVEPTPLLLAEAATTTPRPRQTRNGPTPTPILLARQSNTDVSSTNTTAAPPASAPGRGLLTGAGILLAGVVTCGGTLFVIKRLK